MMRIFTIENGAVSEGAMVGKLTLKGAGIEIPAIIVGEEGRGRKRDILSVHLPQSLYREWQEKGQVRVSFGKLGQTKSGKPKLLVSEEADDDEKALVVFLTKIGFRGGNSHTGDRTGEENASDSWGGTKKRLTFAPFPGEIVCQGEIAQGIAGRMGSGSQLVALMPQNTPFRTGYSGRLYGAPAAHYYLWDGERILGVTWEEREATDLF